MPQTAKWDDPPPRVRVLGVNGPAGLWCPEQLHGDRWWPSPPTADHYESLYVSKTGLALRYIQSKRPKITGSIERGDLFDSESYAMRCSAAEAVDWLQRHGYRPPDDLLQASGVPQPAAPAASVTDDSAGQPPALTAAERLTLRTLGHFDAHILATAAEIHEAMDPHERLSEPTILAAIRKLATLNLAERPQGKRQGARLTIRGRRLASKVID